MATEVAIDASLAVAMPRAGDAPDPSEVPDFGEMEAMEARDWQPRVARGEGQQQLPGEAAAAAADAEDGREDGGTTKEEGGAAEEDEQGKGKAAGGGDEEERLTRLYFVRVPKPEVDDAAVARLQQEFEVQLSKWKLLNETLRMRRMEKNEARNNTTKAQDALEAAKRLMKAKGEELQPFRDHTQDLIARSSALKDEKQQLMCTSEQELDKMISDTEFRLHHETVSLREEKELVNRLKKLNGQRSRVREYEAKHRGLEEKRNNTEGVRASKDALEREMKVLKEEHEACWQVVLELRKVEKAAAEVMKEVAAECEAANREKQAAFDRLKEARAGKKERLGDWNQNRNFGRKVRDLVALGRIDEAQALCVDYNDKMMDKLNTDKEYRDAYLKLWETQRKSSSSMSTLTDAELGLNQQAGKSKKPTSRSLMDIPLEPGQTLADAVIAKAMAEAKAELQGSKIPEEPSSPVAAMELPKPVVHKKQPAAKTENVKSPPKDLAAEESSLAKKNVPKHRSKVDTSFEIPEVIKVAKEQEVPQVAPNPPPKDADGQQQKRKARRKALAEERRKKAIEQNKVREAEKRKVREEAGAKVTDRGLTEADLTELADENNEEEQGDAEGNAKVAAADNVQQRKAQVSKAPPNVLPSKVFQSVRPPPSRKRKSGVKGTLQMVMDTIEKNQIMVVVGGFVFVMLILVILWLLQ